MMVEHKICYNKSGLPSSLIPFSDLISGGGDFLAEISFLGTSCKCDGILLLSLCCLFAGAPPKLPFCELELELEFDEELLLVEENSCFTTTGGSTVLFVITFFDCCCCWTAAGVELVEELLVFPVK